MKKVWTWFRNSNWYIHILGTAMVFACFYTFRHCKKAADKERKVDTVIALQEIREDSITYWKDQFNREHAEKRDAIAYREEIEIVYGDMLKAKAEELDVKEKQITSLTSFNTEQKVKVKELVEKFSKYDTTITKGKDGQPDVIRITQNISDSATLSLRDSLSIAQYYKKHGFLNLKRTNYLDVISYNQNTKITALQGFRIKPAETPVKIRPVVSALWAENGWSAGAGVGVEFKVLGIPTVVSVQRVFK